MAVGDNGEMSESATFTATLPPIMSALRFSGDGGCRIMLDVPESEMGEAVKLLMWRQMPLRVTVKPEEQDAPTISRSKAKKRNV